MIAGETSQAYDEIVTMSLVTGRAIGKKQMYPALKKYVQFMLCLITIIKICVAFVFWLQTLQLIDFSKVYRLKGLKPKYKGHTNFYECCDLTEKVYLM